MLELTKNFILNWVDRYRTIFILIQYSWYLQVMLNSILIDDHYVQIVVFSFEKSSNGQNHPSSYSYFPTA